MSENPNFEYEQERADYRRELREETPPRTYHYSELVSPEASQRARNWFINTNGYGIASHAGADAELASSNLLFTVSGEYMEASHG